MSKYKVGDEFIVKIKEVIDSYNGTLYRSNFSTLVFDEYGLDNLDNVATSANIAVDKAKAYQKGLNDAWKLARKISDISTTYERADMFGYCCNGITVTDILRDFTPQEALAKIKAYEESKAIKVGDVVKTIQAEKQYEFVVTVLNGMGVQGIGSKGDIFMLSQKEVEKTGRHIDIEHLLEQIRGNE